MFDHSGAAAAGSAVMKNLPLLAPMQAKIAK